LERLRSRARYNEASALANAETRGEEKKALEIAKKMLARGRGVDEVAEDTGLTVDDVLRLK
jgi:DNA-binding phage protein